MLFARALCPLPPRPQIEDLEVRAKNGEELNDDQKGKITGKGKVLEDLKKLEDLKATL